MYEAHGVHKRFGGVDALRGVDVVVRPGEVQALLGANGAGKSSLVKILAGVLRPDRGELRLDGTPVRFRSALDAARRGVVIVSQELNLFPEMQVLDNLFLPELPLRFGVQSRREMHRRAQPVAAGLGLDVDLEAPLGALTLAQRQLVEVCRALLRRPRLLILDEPNSALQGDATERLLTIVRALRAAGVGVLYVSHLLEEVFAITDSITVLRDGQVVAERIPVTRTSIPEVVAEMVGEGRERGSMVAPPPPRSRRQARGPLQLRGVVVRGPLAATTFSAHPGEVIALVGLDGSGVHTLLDVLFGRVRPAAGTVTLPDGRRLPAGTPGVVRAGVALVPADRKGRGAMLDKPIYENVAQVRSSVMGVGGPLVRRALLLRRAGERCHELGIRAPSSEVAVGELSGGNQQKVVFAKWLEADPTVVLLDDPTRGVDVVAKTEMHRIIRELAAAGKVVVLASSDLAEVAQLASRALVLYRGRVTTELAGGRLSERHLIEAMNTGRAPGDPPPVAVTPLPAYGPSPSRARPGA